MSVGGIHGPGRAGFDLEAGAVSGADGAAAAGGAAPVGFGARGDEVRAIQEELLEAGFDVGAADGMFGRGTERAISDLQRRSGLTPTGTVDAATRAALALRAGPRIANTVGPGGHNDPVDVRAVQRKLQGLGFYQGAVDGACGPQLQRAIQSFDATVRGLAQHDRPGAEATEARLLRPGEEAERWLRAPNAPSWQRIPRSGTGFRNVDNERHDYAASWLVATLTDAARSYERDYRSGHPRALPIQPNDASLRRGGDTPDHDTHESGLDLDLRLGARPGITFRSRDYDREAVWAQMTAFLDSPDVESVIFNDPELVRRADADPRYAGRVLTDPNGIHDNHVHVDVRPPAIVEQEPT